MTKSRFVRSTEILQKRKKERERRRKGDIPGTDLSTRGLSMIERGSKLKPRVASGID